MEHYGDIDREALTDVEEDIEDTFGDATGIIDDGLVAD